MPKRLSILVLAMCVSGLAQENPGQMGTKPQPSATTPTTPTAKPNTQPSQPAPAKPDSAPQPTVGARPEAANADSSPALQMSNPDVKQLRERIMTALKNNAQLGRANFSVNISDDAIDLTGNADTARERQIARRIVQSFAGNRKVTERITVAGMAPRPEPAATMVPQNPTSQPEKPQTENRPKSEPEKQGDASSQPR